MVDAVASSMLEKADNYYSSLQSEHIASPLLKEATMIMAQAHMHEEEYLLSEHFLSEYLKRYAKESEHEYIEYLRMRAKYMALPNASRDQGLIADAIVTGENFKRNYVRSQYFNIVDTMVTRLYIAQSALNEQIAKLYDRLDKPKGAAYYRSIKQEEWIEWEHVEHADASWYRAIFEGEGDDSWYSFLIPDTQSVVSRHQ
jgi:outer membrane protein assembly factor BamD